MPVTLGSHTLSGTLPFGVSVYGFSAYDSYGYPGGMALSKIATVAKLMLSPKRVTKPVGGQTCLTGTVLSPTNNPVPGIRVDFTVTGANPNRGFAVADNAGKAQFCYTGTAPGQDVVTGVVGAVTDTASVQWTAGNRCDANGDGAFNRLDLPVLRRYVGTRAPGRPEGFRRRRYRDRLRPSRLRAGVGGNAGASGRDPVAPRRLLKSSGPPSGRPGAALRWAGADDFLSLLVPKMRGKGQAGCSL